MLEGLGYRSERLPGSSNTVFHWSNGAGSSA
jgi:hypothetical protein